MYTAAAVMRRLTLYYLQYDTQILCIKYRIIRIVEGLLEGNAVECTEEAQNQFDFVTPESQRVLHENIINFIRFTINIFL